MKNCETLEKVTKETKKLTPEVLDEFVAEYPGLKGDYDEVLEATEQMNLLLKDLNENLMSSDLNDWNRRQVNIHNNLINKVIEFIDDLEKLDSREAEALRVIYNKDISNRLYFTEFALKYLNK